MKKDNFALSLILITAMFVSSCGGAVSNEPPSPKVASTFNEVTIGKQVWMTQNLNVDKFRNGDPIPEAKTQGEWEAYGDAGEAAWCYYDLDPKNGKKYGKLYNWFAVSDPRGLAPQGWHIPSDDEWKGLTDYLGGELKAGAKMKGKSGWRNDGNGTNSSEFSGLPGGNRFFIGTFDGVGYYGYWWSSTETKSIDAWYRALNYSKGSVYRGGSSKTDGFSGRCVRD
jgi:uncharacterized protein (TIGR02145 family)